jgi:kynurenine 3-monooxygenase
MMSTGTQKSVAIMGAGLAGNVMAMYLARRGWNVELYERRPDPRQTAASRGRSINMTLAMRGLAAIAPVLDVAKILELTLPLEGRLVHGLDGSQKFQPYGINKSEVIYAVTRSLLNLRLIDLAEGHQNIKIFFNSRCTAIEKKNWRVDIYDEISQNVRHISPEFVVGADGTFSVVRQQMHHHESANFQQEYIECGYKELIFRAAPGGKFRMANNVLHVWPRGQSMLMAIPNLDGTFASNCILRFQGEGSFATLNTPDKVMEFFYTQFPDAVHLIDGLPYSFLRNPPAGFPTVRAQPWHYGGRIVLIGDACHTVVPFYGLGMNAAFEDCATLDQCLEKHGDNTDLAFHEYEQLRKVHTDVLADLSIANFVELRDKVRSYMLTARKKIIGGLHRAMPKHVMPIYTLMSHSTMPFAKVLARTKSQDRVMRWLGMDIVIALLAGCLACHDFVVNLLEFLRKRPKKLVPPLEIPVATEIRISQSSEPVPLKTAKQKTVS